MLLHRLLLSSRPHLARPIRKHYRIHEREYYRKGVTIVTHTIKTLLFLLPAISVMSTQALPFQPEDVQIKTIQVAKGIYMLQGQGGNIGVSAGQDSLFIIDDQFAPLTEKITAVITALAARPVQFVLNTHWHGDHTGGNENFGKAGALIVAHDNVRRRMSVEQFMEAFNRRVPASPKEALPVVTFSERVTFHLNQDHIHAYHVEPAHTDGDSEIHFHHANVFHMGDLFFNGSYPFIDLSSGGSFTGMLAAVEGVLEKADGNSKIIPGHGELATRQELVAYRDVLKAVKERVSKLIAEGKSLEQVLETQLTAEFDETWGAGFMNPQTFLTIVLQPWACSPAARGLWRRKARRRTRC